MARFEREPSEFVEKLVSLNRVSRPSRGGRIFKFAALMVVGDEKGPRGLRHRQGRRSARGHPQGHRGRQEEHDHCVPVRHQHPPRGDRRSAPAAC